MSCTIWEKSNLSTSSSLLDKSLVLVMHIYMSMTLVRPESSAPNSLNSHASCVGNTCYSQRRASHSSRWKATVPHLSHWRNLLRSLRKNHLERQSYVSCDTDHFNVASSCQSTQKWVSSVYPFTSTYWAIWTQESDIVAKSDGMLKVTWPRTQYDSGQRSGGAEYEIQTI